MRGSRTGRTAWAQPCVVLVQTFPRGRSVARNACTMWPRVYGQARSAELHSHAHDHARQHATAAAGSIWLIPQPEVTPLVQQPHLPVGCPAMPLVQEMVHPRGLDFRNQRRVAILRAQTPPVPFWRIAEVVRNLQGLPSTEDVVRRAYARFNEKKGRVLYKYHKCGRKPWKITRQVGTFVLKTLLRERRHGICTSTTLQAAVAKEYKLTVSTSQIRKYLTARGYRWLPRAQKRLYNAKMRRWRTAFAEEFQALSERALARGIAMAMDGIVLTVPPADPTERKNFCLHGETHMWRKPGEAAKPDLSGNDPYATQVPLVRAIPLWGAIPARGFMEVVYHKHKKLSVEEWAKALDAGRLRRAVDHLQDPATRWPRRMLCDNEKFLTAKCILRRYMEDDLEPLPIPKRSPDLNPIESFWGWLRGRLRARDLDDLKRGRPSLGKAAYKRRVKALLRTKKAQAVAKAKFKAFQKVCLEVVRKRGAAARS